MNNFILNLPLSMKPSSLFFILFNVFISLCGCKFISTTGADISGQKQWLSLLQKPTAITTTFADAQVYQSLPTNFGNGMSPKSLANQPKRNNDGYVLVPGFYEMTCKSYCLHAGTHAPAKGDGYLYASLKGDKKDIVQTIVKQANHKKGISQNNIQMLVWAVLSNTSFKNLSNELKLVAAQLLTPQQLFTLNGGAVGLIPPVILSSITAKLPKPVQRAIALENNMRRLFTQGNSTYEELERLAVLAGRPENSKEYAAGAWSKHPNGYFVRYFPNGYKSTRVQVYVPNFVTPQAKGSKSSNAYQLLAAVEYDATGNVAVPANTGSQRLLQTNEDAGTTQNPNNTTNTPTNPNIDPCKKINNPRDRTENPQASASEQEDYKNIVAYQNRIAKENNWQPNQTGFDTPDDAARAAIFYTNYKSVTENVEYAGNIYLDPKTGKYYFSVPNRGAKSSSDATQSPVPAGAKTVGIYHTHSGDYYKSDEVFSPDDILKAVLQKDRASYLGTPRGSVYKVEPKPQPNCEATQGLGSISRI
jgi:hypothetical protein